MTFQMISLPILTLRRTSSALPEAEQPEEQSDLRREYVERLLAADACVSEYGMQAMMGLFPKDF